MLTNKDKAFLKSVKWGCKDIKLLEKELKENKVRVPYFIRTLDGFLKVAEVKKFKGEQCLKIL